MYNQFFGFQKTPFDIVPNPDLLFMSQRHKVALDHLEFGLMSGAGFILLTGEIGTGKTTLIRNLIRRSIAMDTEIALVFQTNVSADQLLSMLLTEFELPTKPGDKPGALDVLNNFFLETYRLGRKVLIIVDEAQNLSFEALEELRMLSNLQSDDQMLLQIMLVGQPELKQKLMDPKLAQFAQRISVNYHLTGLSPEETYQYITYRLAKVGAASEIFSPDVVALLHQASGGVPRAINVLCAGALLYAYADERQQVTEEDVAQVVEAKDGLGVSAKCLRGKRPKTAPIQTAPITPSQPLAATPPKPPKTKTLAPKAAPPSPPIAASPPPTPPPPPIETDIPAPAVTPVALAQPEDAPQNAEAAGQQATPEIQVQSSPPSPPPASESAAPLAAAAPPLDSAQTAAPVSAQPVMSIPLRPASIMLNAQRIAHVASRQAQESSLLGQPQTSGNQPKGFMEIIGDLASYLLSKIREHVLR